MYILDIKYLRVTLMVELCSCLYILITVAYDLMNKKEQFGKERRMIQVSR